jgi:hypothetical protein
MRCSSFYQRGKKILISIDNMLGGSEKREERRSNGYSVKTTDLCTLKEEIHEPVWNSTS